MEEQRSQEPNMIIARENVPPAQVPTALLETIKTVSAEAKVTGIRVNMRGFLTLEPYIYEHNDVLFFGGFPVTPTPDPFGGTQEIIIDVTDY